MESQPTPPAVLDTVLRAALGDLEAVITAGRNGIPAIFARLPLDVTRDRPVIFEPLRLHNYEPEGPVAFLALRVYRHPMATGEADPHEALDVFIDPASMEGRALLLLLCRAQALLLHVYSSEPSGHYVGTKMLNWGGMARQAARLALAATDERTVSRWPAARDRYLRERTDQP